MKINACGQSLASVRPINTIMTYPESIALHDLIEHHVTIAEAVLSLSKRLAHLEVQIAAQPTQDAPWRPLGRPRS